MRSAERSQALGGCLAGSLPAHNSHPILPVITKQRHFVFHNQCVVATSSIYTLKVCSLNYMLHVGFEMHSIFRVILH